MERHSITQLNSTDRSSIRDQVYRVLARHASSDNHGPLSIKSLFLLTADGLVEQGVIERPEFLGGKGAGGQRFVQLNVPQPTQTFPNYGIPSNIANLIRQTFWELYLQGVLAPASNFRAIVDQYGQDKKQWVSGGLILDLDHVMLTPYGVDVLIESKNRIRVYDPDGYLANFWNATPSPDPEMMRYLSECISVFTTGHLLASVVLLGIASERLIEVLAESLRDALGSPQGDTWFNRKYKNKRNISDRFKAIDGMLMNEYGQELARENLKDAFQGIVTLAFEQIRHARNEIAHPQDRRFSWNEVSGLLHNFVQYFRYVNKIIAFLSTR